MAKQTKAELEAELDAANDTIEDLKTKLALKESKASAKLNLQAFPDDYTTKLVTAVLERGRVYVEGFDPNKDGVLMCRVSGERTAFVVRGLELP